MLQHILNPAFLHSFEKGEGEQLLGPPNPEGDNPESITSVFITKVLIFLWVFSLLLPCFQLVHFIVCPLVNIFVPLSLSLISLPAALPLIMSYQPNTSLCSIIINFIPFSPLLLCFPHTVPSFNFCFSHLFLLPFWSFHQSSCFCSFFFITFHTTQQSVIPGVNVRGDHVKGQHVCSHTSHVIKKKTKKTGIFSALKALRLVVRFWCDIFVCQDPLLLIC